MKKIVTILFLIISNFIFGQAPNKMTYQSVIRNAQNELLNNVNVGVRINIIQESPTGTVVYTEVHSQTTNSNGLLALNIGEGTTTNSLSTINWGQSPYFIEIGIDPNGGTNYSVIGTNELMSVPYALYAANSAPGPQGLQGETGDQGPIGLTGPQGIKGDTGVAGPQGLQGETGPQGLQGPIGLTGPQGIKGDTGAVGPQGLQGEIGPQGPIGLTGATGPQGIKGDTGVAGSQGLQGETGPQGPIGLTGPQGIKGDTGVAGPQGLQGETGSQGPIGLTGATGPQGIKGDTGVAGPQGLQGETGSQGPIGLTGATGPQGIKGDTGAIGPAGPLVDGTAGNLLYHNGTNWVALGSGISGQLLQSNGTNAPTWKSARVCYADRDGDGKGDKYSRFVTYDTTCPTGFVENDTDCDDNNPTNTVAVPTATVATNRLATSAIANWRSVNYATHYLLDVATDSNFSNMVSGYNGYNVGNVTTYLIANLDACTQYYYRVRAVSICTTSANSQIISISGYNCTTFNFTGGEQTFTVPEGITTLNVKLWGAQGGSTVFDAGGRGGYVFGLLNVLPNANLVIISGGKGIEGVEGGFGGGGNSCITSTQQLCSGGGRSSIKINGIDVVTAGGGGAANRYAYPTLGKNGGLPGTGSGGSGSCGNTVGAGGTSYTTNTAFSLITSIIGENTGNGKVQISW